MQAAAQVNVSPRLTSYAIKVLQNGSRELIAAVESGAVAVTPAAVLAGLPEAEQKNVVAAGAKEAARKVRELRAGKSSAACAEPASSPSASPGCFGVVCVQALGPLQSAEPGVLPMRAAGSKHNVVFLWVDSGGLHDAIDALKSRGFRYAPSGS